MADLDNRTRRGGAAASESAEPLATDTSGKSQTRNDTP
jgi:hypothetical protein